MNRALGAAVLACGFALGCSGGGAASGGGDGGSDLGPASAMVTGTLGKGDFVPAVALFTNDTSPQAGAGATKIVLITDADYCTFLADTFSFEKPYPKNSQAVTIFFEPVLAGPVSATVGAAVQAQGFIADPYCGELENIQFDGGDVTVTNISSDELSGSLDVTGPAGISAKGTFTADSCRGVSFPTNHPPTCP